MSIRFASFFCAASLASAVSAAPVDDLYEAIGAPQIIAVMHLEGLAYGDDLASGMMSMTPDAGWRDLIERIYDTERMEDTVRAGLVAELEGTDLTPLLDFFGSEGGRQVVQMEISAREALLESDVEEAARAAFRDTLEESPEDLGLLDDFEAANDLIEANVTGAMNANSLFYTGLADGGALDMSEQDILKDVWSQEEETREDTREWLYAFMLLAYGPLDDDLMAEYVALNASDAGRALNRALFVGFNKMYDDISYALGLAAAQRMSAQEL